MPGTKQKASSSSSSAIPVPKKLKKILSKRKHREASNGHEDHHHVHSSSCSHGVPTSAKRQRMLNRKESADVENEEEVNESDAINAGVTNEEVTEETRDEYKKFGRQIFEYLISPYSLQDFYDEYWEKKQLFIKRSGKKKVKGSTSSAPGNGSASSSAHNYYTYFQVGENVKVMNGNGDHTVKLDITRETIEKWIDRSEMEYGNDIEISKHARGKKVLMTPEVRKTSLSEIQDFVQSGCTVKLMNPQLYSDSVLNLLSSLELFFKVPLKAHFLLTPPKSYGVAPHMVSGDVFILQLEGSKTWRIFKSHEEKHNSLNLNNQQSIFLTQEDMQTLEPVTEETLVAGDLLYIPKGYVQQAYTDEEQDTHSLHLAITCNAPKTRWADFMALALTKALENAVEEDPEFSRTIPRTTYDFFGLYPASRQVNDRTDGEDIAEDTVDPRREQFMDQFEKLMAKLIDFLPYDYAADQLAQEFYAKRLPPLLSEKDRWHQFGGMKAAKKLNLDTQVRLVRKDAIRLAAEEHEVILSTYTNNPRVSTGTESLATALETTSIVLPIDCGAAASLLIDTYPDYISVRELKISEEGDEKESIEFAQTLFEKGVLVTVPAPKRTLPE